MKKIISLLMVVAMLLSTMLFVVPASASKDKSMATAENIDYIDALYFDKEPTIDGYVSEAEWGEFSFDVEATDCATQDDTDPYNRFIFWRTGDITDYNSWTYQVWFRWDENYFYVAARVSDPDVHALKHGTTNTWNGDAIQMRVDTKGPNAATDGQEFVIDDNYTVPWSSKNIPDFLFGYVEIAGGFSEAWENTSNKGMTSFSNNPMGVAKCVVAPCGSSYSSDTQSGITTYEVAIPWAYVLNGEIDNDKQQITSLEYATYSTGRRGNLRGGIGREFGISLVNLEDGNNPDATYDAWMAWGSGICNDHQTLGAKSATGSNSVMLSEEKVVQGDYQKYDPTSLLDATFSEVNWDKKGVFYDYLAGDTAKTNPIKYEDLSVLTYDKDPDGDRSVFGSDEYLGSCTDIGGDHKNVLDYSKFIGSDPGTPDNPSTDSMTYIDTRDGDIHYEFPTSYTFEMDIRYCDTVVVAPAYETAMYNWFGGATVFDFMCGYFFNDNAFKVVNTNDATQVLAEKPYDLKKDNWYKWRFQFDNESCTCRLWIDDLSTTADDGEGWGEMIFNVRWRYFYYAGVEETLLLFRQMNVQPQYDNIKIYNFGSISDVQAAEENNNGTGGGGTTTTTETGGGEVSIDISKVYKKDGNWHVPVFAKSEYASATQLSFTLEYDPAKSEFTGVEGLEEGTYTVEETTKGKVQLTVKDFAAIKALKTGDKYFEFVLKALDDSAKAQDLGLKLSDSYVYTVTTGDAMAFIIIGGALAVAAAATVVIIRRKKEEE